MTIELAQRRMIEKPWGVADPGIWGGGATQAGLVGEIWYEAKKSTQGHPKLLLKLLLTTEPLSIQVHPDDGYARSIGLANGKTEAWHILAAARDSKIALGLKTEISPAELRQAMEDGSITECVAWTTTRAGETIAVPAGTIHAIGAGLVIAEIQQFSDATFRIFDHGRERPLQIEHAMAVATRLPARGAVVPQQIDAERRLLTSNRYFAFERIELAAGSTWRLDAARETWMLIIAGGGHCGSFDVSAGAAVYALADHVDISAGEDGVVALVAYTGEAGIARNLLQRRHEPQRAVERAAGVPALPATVVRAKAIYASHRGEAGA